MVLRNEIPKHQLEMSSVLRRSGNLSAVQRPTVGDTKTSLVPDDHMGWLRCDGRLLNVAEYIQLFKIIRYQFGGSGSQFRLPNPEGRVLAFVGQPQDQVGNPVANTNTWDMGDLSGAEIHTLTLREMPVHNHDFYDLSGTTVALQGTVFGRTDISGAHNHGGLTDPSGAHTHSITQTDHYHSLSITDAGGSGAIDDAGSSGGGSTGGAQANITIDSVDNHRHGIQVDGAHSHRIRRAGGNQPHNNIQPTIWLGNLFVYCGKLFTGSDGFQAPYSSNKFPFPSTGEPIF